MTAGTILILEDDPAIRDLFDIALSGDGHAVRLCDSVEQLVEVARGTDGCLALVDPWSTNPGTLDDDERRQLTMLARAVPTILCTARTWARDGAAEDLGCVAVLPKPFELDELCAVVASWVTQLREDGAAARDQARELRALGREALTRLGRARRALDGAAEV